MTVQAAGTGATVAGAVIGAGTLNQPRSGPADVVVLGGELARTGASELTVLIAIAIALVVAGVLAMGLVQRHDRVFARSPG